MVAVLVFGGWACGSPMAPPKRSTWPESPEWVVREVRFEEYFSPGLDYMVTVSCEVERLGGPKERTVTVFVEQGQRVLAEHAEDITLGEGERATIRYNAPEAGLLGGPLALGCSVDAGADRMTCRSGWAAEVPSGASALEDGFTEVNLGLDPLHRRPVSVHRCVAR